MRSKCEAIGYRLAGIHRLIEDVSAVNKLNSITPSKHNADGLSILGRDEGHRHCIFGLQTTYQLTACFASPFVTPNMQRIASTKKPGVTRKIML